MYIFGIPILKKGCAKKDYHCLNVRSGRGKDRDRIVRLSAHEKAAKFGFLSPCADGKVFPVQVPLFERENSWR